MRPLKMLFRLAFLLSVAFLARAEGPIDLAGVYRVEGTNPNGSKYHGMVALAQTNDQFDFTWWIGKDGFRGSGHFAGKMLMVNWGDKTPVIYTFGDEGALDGEWADGSATETLELVANAAPGDIGLSEGSYKVGGKNADGSGYQGNVEITEQGDGYHLTWQVGSSSYEAMARLPAICSPWIGALPRRWSMLLNPTAA
jgi:hypothetical protein